MEDNCLQIYQNRITELELQIAYYRRENERLSAQNEVLHETAWDLVRKLRAIDKKIG